MAEDLANAIRAAGITASFGVPGSGPTLKLVDALGKLGVPFHLSHHEGSAAIMAATYGHVAGSAGLSLSIKGPGLTNAIPGIALAWFEAFPLVHIAESAAADAPAWTAHKRLPQRQMCEAITKGAGQLSPDGSSAREAAALAIAEEPAPVLMEFGGEPGFHKRPSDAPSHLDGRIKDAVDQIRRAQAPVIIVGGFAARQKLGDGIAALKIPVFTTVAAKGVVDESLPSSAGIFTGVDEHLTPEARVLPEADLVIAVGLTARELLKVKPFHAPAIHIGNTGTTGFEGFGFGVTLSENYLPEILHALEAKQWGAEAIDGSKKAVRAHLTRGFLPGRLYEGVHQHFSGLARMVVDTGSFCTVAEYMWAAKRADLFLASAQGRYMGTALPMALGAALQDRSVPTIAVVGDGGIGTYLADVKIAVQNRLPLLLVLMSDGGFGSIRYSARRNNYDLAPIQSDQRSWVPVLEGLGVPGQQVRTEAAFSDALTGWTPAQGPCFIEAVFDPVLYEDMTSGVRI